MRKRGNLACFRIRYGDVLLGSLKQDIPPGGILVSTEGHGIALLDVAGGNHFVQSGDLPALSIVSNEGKVLAKKTLRDLGLPTFNGGGFNVQWLQTAWIDDRKQEVVIVGNSRRFDGKEPRFVAVKMKGGNVRQGDSNDVVEVFRRINRNGLGPALDVVRECCLRKEVAQLLPAIVDDKNLSALIRLKAALALVESGDRKYDEVIVSIAKAACVGLSDNKLTPCEKGDLFENCITAMPAFGDVFGKERLSDLYYIAQHSNYPVAAHFAFRKLGKAGVPLLVKILRNGGDKEGQVFAAYLFCDLKPTSNEAIDALISASKSEARSRSDVPLRQVAAEALGEIGPSARPALSELRRLAEDGDRDVSDAAKKAIARIMNAPRK